MKFGKLTVIRLSHKDKWGMLHWLCECECGVEKTFIGNNLKSGHSTSCGCSIHPKDITGMKFGRLTVIEIAYKGEDGKYRWRCKCDCGGETTPTSNGLIAGRSTSCGCTRLKHDLTGSVFGALTVIGGAGIDEHGKRKWECVCVCGNKLIAHSYDIRKKRIKSCGCLSIKKTLPEGESAFNRIYYDYIRASKKRGYDWELSKDEFRDLTKKYCYYCGALPSNRRKAFSGNGGYTYSGIDRVNNKIGYQIDNVVPCCAACNRAKDTKTLKGFLDMIKKIHSNLNL